MKFRIFAFFVIAIFLDTVSVFAEVGPANNAGSPRMQIDDPSFDFGEVTQGAKVNHAFTITNTGQAPLKIEHILSACGCTAAVIDSNIIEPAQSTQVRVSFDTSGFQGAKVKTIRLYTNDTQKFSVVLTIQGVIKPDVQVSVPRVAFGDVSHGEQKSLKFTVSSLGDSGIKILEVESRSPFVEVAQENLSDSKVLVTATLKSTLPIGIFRDRVVIKTTSRNNPVVNLAVFARVQGDLLLEPAAVSFGLVDWKNNSTVSKSVRLISQSKEPIRVVSIDSDNPSVSAELRPLTDGKGQLINVTAKKGLSGVFRARIKIISNHNDPEQRELNLPVFGIVNTDS